MSLVQVGCLCQSGDGTIVLGGAMKFTWFNLMPWPHLPDDFREKNHSVWVDIDSRLFDPVKANAMYHEYMDQLEYAEHAGLRRHRGQRAPPERLRADAVART